MTPAAVRSALERWFERAVEAGHPAAALPEALVGLPSPPSVLLTVGKASMAMAGAALAHGVRPRAGLVVTRRGEGRPLSGLEVLEASHPEPDLSSLAAGERLLDLARAAGEEDHVLVLLSGGASALACAPAAGLSLEAKQAMTRALLGCGADIGEINLVRRHLSRIKGGRLAAEAWPARITTFAVSDVVGDAPQDIGSGPTAADPTTVEQARAVLARYGLAGPTQGWSESRKPLDRCFERASFRVIASAAKSLAAAAAEARAAGFEVLDLGEIQGEAREVGAAHGARAAAYAGRKGRYALISGGELTVTLRGSGRGGPNLEYAAALALAVDGVAHLAALAGDTDGLDGVSGACGAFVSGSSARRAEAAGLSFQAALAVSDTASAFQRLGDLYAPGPSGTNVNDLRIILAGQDLGELS